MTKLCYFCQKRIEHGCVCSRCALELELEIANVSNRKY